MIYGNFIQESYDMNIIDEFLYIQNSICEEFDNFDSLLEFNKEEFKDKVDEKLAKFGETVITKMQEFLKKLKDFIQIGIPKITLFINNKVNGYYIKKINEKNDLYLKDIEISTNNFTHFDLFSKMEDFLHKDFDKVINVNYDEDEHPIVMMGNSMRIFEDNYNKISKVIKDTNSTGDYKTPKKKVSGTLKDIVNKYFQEEITMLQSLSDKNTWNIDLKHYQELINKLKNDNDLEKYFINSSKVRHIKEYIEMYTKYISLKIRSVNLMYNQLNSELSNLLRATNNYKAENDPKIDTVKVDK